MSTQQIFFQLQERYKNKVFQLINVTAKGETAIMFLLVSVCLSVMLLNILSTTGYILVIFLHVHLQLINFWKQSKSKWTSQPSKKTRVFIFI